MHPSLERRRLEAAAASGGISNDAIHDAALKWMRELGLSGDLLEFGAGQGTLVARLAREGFRGSLTGADIMRRPQGVPEAVAWLAGDLNQPLPVRDASFDVVLSTEVIEHLENPRAVFREFFRVLRPGGTVLLTTPNQESLRSLLSLLLYGHFVAFRDESYPAHITALLRKDFERICAESGFAPPDFRFTDRGAIPKLPAVQWQQVGGSLLRGRWFSDNLLVRARRG